MHEGLLHTSTRKTAQKRWETETRGFLGDALGVSQEAREFAEGLLDPTSEHAASSIAWLVERKIDPTEIGAEAYREVAAALQIHERKLAELEKRRRHHREDYDRLKATRTRSSRMPNLSPIMTTERQRRANKANALHSSGPSSAAGKRKVSQNARRHGLTTPLPWDQVTRWYQIILADGAARPGFASRDPRLQAALRLAEAEAHLARVVQAERDHLFEMHTRLQQDACDMPRLDRILARLKQGQHIDFEDQDVLLAMAERLTDDPVQAKGARLSARLSPTRPEAMRRTLRTSTRYRREAEGARRTSLKHWIKVSS